MSFQGHLPLFDQPIDLKIFRPIHYLGSKFRMLDFIEEVVNDLNNSGRACDLFAGSGSVSYQLSRKRPVISVDIQEYSKVICSALLNPAPLAKDFSSFIEECKNSEFAKNILWAIEPLILFEKQAIINGYQGNLEPLCDLLEHSSIVTYQSSGFLGTNCLLLESIKNVESRLKSLNLADSIETMCLRHFGGVYFSFLQTAHIDILLHHIHQKKLVATNPYLAALLSTVSNAVNTVGKQFAQPLRPRDSKGEPKKNILTKIQKDRGISIFSEFSEWVKKYSIISDSQYDHKILTMDYSDALDSLPSDTTVVYADPPYTRDHYSRFYHVLETLCLRDNPKISTSNLNGKIQLSRGIYREHRYQSPFCIKTQAPSAFEKLFYKVSQKDAALVLSYSQFDETKNSHPRLLTINKLQLLAQKYFQTVDVLSPGEFTHSKLNHADRHLEASSHAESLIVCR